MRETETERESLWTHAIHHRAIVSIITRRRHGLATDTLMTDRQPDRQTDSQPALHSHPNHHSNHMICTCLVRTLTPIYPMYLLPKRCRAGQIVGQTVNGHQVTTVNRNFPPSCELSKQGGSRKSEINHLSAREKTSKKVSNKQKILCVHCSYHHSPDYLPSWLSTLLAIHPHHASQS